MSDFNLDSDDALVGQLISLWTADSDADQPTFDDLFDSMPTGWTSMGYIQPAGLKPSFGRDIKDIDAAQSFYPILSLVTGKPTEVQAELLQWNSDTIREALGGAVITTDGGGFMIEPEDETFLFERQVFFGTQYGDKILGVGFRRAINTRAFDPSLVRDDASALAVGFKLLGPPTGEKPFYILTNMPNVAADGS